VRWALLVLQLLQMPLQQQLRRCHQVHSLVQHRRRQLLHHLQKAAPTLAVASLLLAGLASATSVARTSTTAAQTFGQPARSHKMETALGRVGRVAAPAAPRQRLRHRHQHVSCGRRRWAFAGSRGSWPGQASLSPSNACAHHRWFPTRTPVAMNVLKPKPPRG